MGKNVFANGMEIAHKAGDANVIAAFPDVCMSPPSPPAGPIPLPYPNTSKSSDLEDGSKTVLIAGKPLALKDQSFYKTSPLGDEAATRSFGASVMTHGITGKTYFQASSMNVSVEGKNVCRHLDITTSNHASYPGSTPPMPNMEAMVALALARIKELQCPCCGSKDCPAAFKSGETPQSFEDFYKVNEPHPSPRPKFKGTLSDRGKRRSQRLSEILSSKEVSCSCGPGNRVFPEPPCDVFRPADDAKRTEKIETAWDEHRHEFVAAWERSSGRKLPSIDSAMAASRAEAGGSFKTDGEAKAALTKAQDQTRINHLVPKQAGGCPTSPGNLQPQSELCTFCQGIDTEFTKSWQ